MPQAGYAALALLLWTCVLLCPALARICTASLARFADLWADPEQMLFVRCAFRGEGDQQCQRGALAAAGRVNVCDLHAAYAPAPPAPAAAAALAPAPVTAAAAAAAAAAASSAS